MRHARDQANLTQRAAAEAIEEKSKTYIAWESGERSPRIEDIPKLAAAFGLSETSLVRQIFRAIRDS